MAAVISKIKTFWFLGRMLIKMTNTNKNVVVEPFLEL